MMSIHIQLNTKCDASVKPHGVCSLFFIDQIKFTFSLKFNYVIWTVSFARVAPIYIGTNIYCNAWIIAF